MPTHSKQRINNEPTVRNRMANGLKKSFMTFPLEIGVTLYFTPSNVGLGLLSGLENRCINPRYMPNIIHAAKPAKTIFVASLSFPEVMKMRMTVIIARIEHKIVPIM